MLKKIVTSSGIIIIILFSFFSVAQAGFLTGNTAESLRSNADKIQESAGFDSSLTLGEAVAVIVKTFLGLLGVIFVILIIIAGYNWMTAAGDEEKIKKATSTIRSAIIGLIIIVAAYAITYFVFANLPGAGPGAEAAIGA
jgi:cytochrome bd-type quinol oxidase subunit 2